MKKILVLAAVMVLVGAFPAQAEENVWVQKHVKVHHDSDGSGWLGVAIAHTETQTNDGPVERELKVAKVFEDSPAAQAGFQEGDVLVSIDGQTVTSADEFVKAVRGHQAGDALTTVVLRDGREVTLNATLGERPAGRVLGLGGHKGFTLKLDEDGEFNFEDLDLGDMSIHLQQLKDGMLQLGDAEVVLRNVLKCDDEAPCVMKLGSMNRPRLGVRVEPLTDQLADYFNVDNGLLVSEVIAGSAAEKAGLKAGDIIRSVNGEPIGSVSELRHGLAEVELPGTIRLDVRRKGRNISVDANLEAPENQEGTPFNMKFQTRTKERANRLKI